MWCWRPGVEWWLGMARKLVSIDPVVVLAGGVLTSCAGITGRVRRPAFDRVLPALLTYTNKWRGTNHYIVFLFFVLQTSLVILLHADATGLLELTFACLGVMALVAFGCILLNLKREDIQSDVVELYLWTGDGAAWTAGPSARRPGHLHQFALYFVVFTSTMFVMLERVFILRLLYILQQLFPSRGAQDGIAEVIEAAKSQGKVKEGCRNGARGGRTITAVLQEIYLPPIVFFFKTPTLSVLDKAILYVRKNEHTQSARGTREQRCKLGWRL